MSQGRKDIKKHSKDKTRLEKHEDHQVWVSNRNNRKVFL